jgi:antirestriction protein ArdC
MAQAADYRTPRFLTCKQALEVGCHVNRGEHGTKVYFVKQLQVRDDGRDDKSPPRLVPMLREYTLFNVDQCGNLPDGINTGKAMRVRNPDMRDEPAGEFLRPSRKSPAQIPIARELSRPFQVGSTRCPSQ